MGSLIRRLFKYLAYAAAAGVMLLALLVGIARLLLPLVADYQEDIRAWAGQATGLEVQFEHISASWPIAGPEIQFLDVTVHSPDDHQPVFVADRLDIGISLVTLLRDQEITVSRVGVQNTQVEVQRDTDGTLWIQGRPLDDLLRERDPERPLPEIDVELRDVGIAWRDTGRDDELLDFRIDRLDVALGDAELNLEGDVDLPAQFGTRATLSVDMPVALLQQDPGEDAEDSGQWNVYATGESLDLARMLAYALGMPTPVVSASGNVVLWAEFAGSGPMGVTTEFDLADLELRRSQDETDRYLSMRGRVEWARAGDGWVIAGSDLALRRDGFFSPNSDFSVASQPGDANGARHWEANAEFFRLHDWYPVLRAFASDEFRRDSLPEEINGDVSDVRVDALVTPNSSPAYSVELRFEDLGIVGVGDGDGVVGVTGTVVADQAGGRLQIDSDEAALSYPRLFAAPLAVERLEGFFVWRVTPDGVRVLSDNVQVRTAFGEASSRFELDFPSNGESPYMDMTATATVSHAAPVVEYLPLRRFPPNVGEWLRRAVVDGHTPGADIAVRGPMRKFPFPNGEGVFLIGVDVVDGIVDYAPGWPIVEDIEGRLVFDGVSLYTTRNRANYGGINIVDANVIIPDLRRAELSVTGPQAANLEQALGFLRASPIADAIGPTLDRVSGSGELQAEVDFHLPIKRLRDYELKLDVTTEESTLDLERLDFGLSKIAGDIRIRNTKFYADEVSAELLGEPVSIRMRPAEAGGRYAQFVTVDGRTPVRTWIDTFKLPQSGKFSGEADWRALVMFPARDESGASPPLHILVRSDLVGAESRMPAPVAKTADAARVFELDAAFPEDGLLEVTGRLDDELSWSLQFKEVDGLWRVERGAVHAGGASALLPLEPGIELSGHLEFVRIDDWFALAEGETDSTWQEFYNSAVLRVDRMSLFGQVFPDVRLDARRDGSNWQFSVDGPNLAGVLNLPLAPDNDNPAVLDMERLWLLETDPGDQGDSDPRSVIPVRVSATDFVLGQLGFGSLNANLTSTPSGVVIEPIKMQGDTFTIEGDAAWLVHPNDDTLRQSSMHLDLNGSDIKAILVSFGYDPVIEGEAVAASVDLTWAGAPDGALLDRADGSFSVEMQKGAVLSLEPGGGRLLGVLSVTALPRRLALDFRDVTDEGLGFDTLRGDFTVDAGNVYTCNLGLEGSVADMGIVGRTGLTDEDYDQLAVVRPHVSNLLAIGGTVVAGPAAGAAMLLFSQIFRKPLSQLGESYYHITGNWDDPEVKQLRGSEVDVTPLKNCEAYLEDALANSLQD